MKLIVIQIVRPNFSRDSTDCVRLRHDLRGQCLGSPPGPFNGYGPTRYQRLVKETDRPTSGVVRAGHPPLPASTPIVLGLVLGDEPVLRRWAGELTFGGRFNGRRLEEQTVGH